MNLLLEAWKEGRSSLTTLVSDFIIFVAALLIVTASHLLVPYLPIPERFQLAVEHLHTLTIYACLLVLSATTLLQLAYAAARKLRHA